MTTRRARADSPPILEARTTTLPYGGIQTDAFKSIVVLELNSVAVEDGGNGAGEVSGTDRGSQADPIRRLPQRVCALLRRSPLLLWSMSFVGRSSLELLLHDLK